MCFFLDSFYRTNQELSELIGCDEHIYRLRQGNPVLIPGISLGVCNAHDSAKISDESGGSDEVSLGLMLDVCFVLEFYPVSVQ